MEKKGEILTQLALISDLFERANMESDTTNVILTVNREEFDRLFHLITKKASTTLAVIDDTFTVRIGVVKYMFTVNKNSA